MNADPIKTLILTQPDVRAVAAMPMVVDAVEAAFVAHGRGEVLMPPKVYLDLPEVGGDFRAMPAAMAGVAGVKWVNAHPHNPARHGLPSVMGVYILSDPATAVPLAIMDATWLTALRTGAAAAVASRHLARPDARSIGFVGCGVQARTLLAAHRVTHPALEEVIVSDKSAEAAARFAVEAKGQVGTVAEAAACDIVCTTTPSSEPVVHAQDVQPGAHINAMGADAAGKQELDPQILLAARVFVDDPAQALHSGEVNVPLHRGQLVADDIVGTLGAVIAGTLPGRTAARDITVFDSTGLAIQDLAVARAVASIARAAGVGLSVDLVGG